MRFEIRAGGLIFILLCLGGLSATVFLFGLIAGHEMARQEQVAQEAAAVYPLPTLPAAMATPAPAISQASAIPGEKVPPASGAPSAALPKSSSGSHSTSKRSALAALNPSASGEGPGGSEESEESSTDENPDVASAPAPTPAATHKNYSVQIEAVMDRQGANDMVAKLKRMGYSPYTVETDIGGQTWYRVRVGPYPTAEEAKAVEARLHHEYGAGSTH